MNRWEEEIQKMINCIEDNLLNKPSLQTLSNQIGYSPYYCSSQFHSIVGVTLKSYIAKRRLCLATLEIRDTNTRILDIALKYGYSSQQSLTRAFTTAYHCTPAMYRKNPFPIPLSSKKELLFPENNSNNNLTTNYTTLTNVKFRIEYIPNHLFVGIGDINTQDYDSFFQIYDHQFVLETIAKLTYLIHPMFNKATGGWFMEKEKQGYIYGIGIDSIMDDVDYINDNFRHFIIPASFYLVFYHPPFDAELNKYEVIKRVQEFAWKFHPKSLGYQWNHDSPLTYERYHPEILGYQIMRPIIKI